MQQTQVRRQLAGTAKRSAPPAAPAVGRGTAKQRGTKAGPRRPARPAPARSTAARKSDGAQQQVPPWAQKRSPRRAIAAAVVIFMVIVFVAIWNWSAGITPSFPTTSAVPSVTATSSAAEATATIEDQADAKADPRTATAQVAAQNAIQQLFTWNPTSDPSRGAALVRAKPWLTGTLLTQAEGYQGQPDGGRTDALWAQWQRQQASITAEVAITNVPQQKPSAETIELRVTQKVIAPQTHPQQAGKWRLRANLTRTSDGWRLASYTAEAI